MGIECYCLVENIFDPASSYQNNLSDTFIASFSYVSFFEEEKCDATYIVIIFLDLEIDYELF